MRLVILLALVACGKEQTPAQQCASAAKHGVDAMIDQARGRVANAQLPDDVKQRILARQQRLETASARMRTVFTDRCVADKWSKKVLDCYAKISTLEDMRACRTQLTAEQQAALQRDELALLSEGTDIAAPTGSGDHRAELLDRAIADARKAITDATNDADRATAQEQLDNLLQEKAKLSGQVAPAAQ